MNEKIIWDEFGKVELRVGTVIEIEDFPLNDFQAKAKSEALDFVRDEQVWSQLVRAEGSNGVVENLQLPFRGETR